MPMAVKGRFWLHLVLVCILLAVKSLIDSSKCVETSTQDAKGKIVLERVESGKERILTEWKLFVTQFCLYEFENLKVWVQEGLEKSLKSIH